MFRDVLTNTQPMILGGQVYATAALLGSASYALLLHPGAQNRFRTFGMVHRFYPAGICRGVKHRNGPPFGEPFRFDINKSSLHAKTIAFDGETMFVGSFNYDQRLQYLNNETGLMFTAPKIAGEAAKRF